MQKRRFWITGAAVGAGGLGLAAACGAVIVASRLIDEFIKPHRSLAEEQEYWKIPQEWRISLTAGGFEPPPSRHRSLTFCAADGPRLRGDFWAQPQPAPTMVICHGYRTASMHLHPLAALEYALGYNVMLFDFRGHGESESVFTSGGTAEVNDLLAALTVASQQPETLPGKICIHGFSMGASIALLALPHYEVAALIADSPYVYFDEILRRLVGYRYALSQRDAPAKELSYQAHTPAALIIRAIIAVGFLVFRMRFGYPLKNRLDTRFKHWKTMSEKPFHPSRPPTPVLLIQAMGDELIPIEHTCQLVARAKKYGVPMEVYFVDHATHCGAFKHNPQQYIAVLQHFVAHHLGDDLMTNAVQERRILDFLYRQAQQESAASFPLLSAL